MMRKTMRRFMSRNFALAAFASLAVVLQAGPARAQWVTTGSTATNQGPVGIGTMSSSSPSTS